MNYSSIKTYLDNQKIKVVGIYDFEKKKVKYSEKIKGWKIDKFRGDEEIVRSYIITKLVNELGYKPENIELEKVYDIGRPKVNKPRIDVNENDILKEYLAYLFNSIIGRFYFKYSAKGKNQTMVKISSDELNNFFLPIPPLKFQQKIVVEIKAELDKHKE